MFRLENLWVGAVCLLLVTARGAGLPYDSLPEEFGKRIERISAYPTASTILLHSVRKHWMGSTGIQAYQVHEARYMGDSAGVAEWRVIQIPFVEGRDSVEISAVTTYFPEGEPHDSDPVDDMEIVAAEPLRSAPDYAKFKEYRIRVPKLRVGAIVELKYRVIINKPLVPWEYGRLDLLTTTPVIYREYVAKVPKGDTTNFALENGAPQPKLDSNFALWYLPETRGIALDSLQQFRLSIPSIQWSSLDDWAPLRAELRARISAASADSLIIPPGLARRLERVQAGEGRLELVRTWAGSTLKLLDYPYHRDFPLTLRKAADVLASGYGNALELAVVVRKIGQQLGVESELALRFDREPQVPQLADWRGVLLEIARGDSVRFVHPHWTDPGKNLEVADTWLLSLSAAAGGPVLAPAPRW